MAAPASGEAVGLLHRQGKAPRWLCAAVSCGLWQSGGAEWQPQQTVQSSSSGRAGVLNYLITHKNTKMKNNNDNDWMKNEMKSMVKAMLPLWLAAAILSIGSVLGVIYFIFWCLRHFGIIG